ncbi:hypothetical protein D9615_006960 [Tricholomella constricta]|uniref:Uncharacterized protein n=1 Tax=Tricholomella constricta TaxID=117010 RepID=A0A8H5M2G8_9AGAR|nr:hypothetical protein D9615_006960 [Tricholomella constricta]
MLERTSLSKSLSSISYFFSGFDSERSVIFMPTKKMIPGVIPKTVDTLEISLWEEFVVKKQERLCDRLDDLGGCRISSISHYRDRGSMPHELIIVEIWSGADHRFLCLERSNQGEEEESANTGNYTCVTFSSVIDNLIKSHYYWTYKLVQTLTFPPGFNTISVVDIVALATTVTSCAQNYSLYAHVRLWWAAMFFESLKRRAVDHEGVRFAKGPLYAERGKMLKLNVVDAECKLLAPELTAKAKKILANCQSAEEIEEFQQAINNDSQLAGDDLAENPVETMMGRWDTSAKELTAALQASVGAAIAERDAVKISNAKLADNNAKLAALERAELAQQMAERDTALAAERAGHAKLEQQQAQWMADHDAAMAAARADHEAEMAAIRVERAKLAQQMAEQNAKHEQQVTDIMAQMKVLKASPSATAQHLIQAEPSSIAAS